MSKDKPRYRFLYRSGGIYFWENTKPLDSRTEQIYCNASWFWHNCPDYAKILGQVYYPKQDQNGNNDDAVP